MRRVKRGLLIVIILGLLLSSITTRPRAASTTMTLATWPLALQGNWYHYDDNGDYDTVTFAPHRFKTTERQSGTDYQTSLAVHQRVLDLNPNQLRQRPHWGVVRQRELSGGTWLNVRPWNQTLGTGWDFNVTQQTLNRQFVPILSQTSSLGTWAYEHYFKSKHLAKTYRDQHFSGEVYGTSY